MTLETLEDRLVDRLVWRATAAGTTAFVALTPRAEIDLNRDEREIDPVLVAPPLPASQIVQSARARGGIGLIPSRIAGAGAIWRQRISRGELDRRIGEIHRPYHEALGAALIAARERFGAAILLDCHSMPPRGAQAAATGEQAASVVFGDRHGTTISPDLLAAAVAGAQALGYRTASTRLMPAAMSPAATAGRRRISTLFRSSSTGRSTSTSSFAIPVPASISPAG